MDGCIPMFIVVIVFAVYQVVVLRHDCQDLTAERGCQSVDTDRDR